MQAGIDDWTYHVTSLCSPFDLVSQINFNSTDGASLICLVPLEQALLMEILVTALPNLELGVVLQVLSLVHLFIRSALLELLGQLLVALERLTANNALPVNRHVLLQPLDLLLLLLHELLLVHQLLLVVLFLLDKFLRE